MNAIVMAPMGLATMARLSMTNAVLAFNKAGCRRPCVILYWFVFSVRKAVTRAFFCLATVSSKRAALFLIIAVEARRVFPDKARIAEARGTIISLFSLNNPGALVKAFKK